MARSSSAMQRSPETWAGDGQQGAAGGAPLDGLVVVDLSRVLSGPYATMLMGDLGARVIKVERPGGGDDTRAWGPPFLGEGEERESTYFLSVNRNKESVALDLTKPEDRAVLKRLVARADVVVENFRPGVLDRLGLGHGALQELNPALVILSITGFGHDGPYATRPGFDQILQGESGLMSLTGLAPDQPLKVGVPISDILAGVFGVVGVLAALHEREHSGRGDVVHTSLLAASIAVQTFQGARWLLGGVLPQPEGNRHSTVVPYGDFACRGERIQIAVGNDEIWRRFAVLLGLDREVDARRFSTNERRMAEREALTALIENRLQERSAADWLALFEENGVPAGRVKRLDEVYSDPQVLSQGLVVEVAHPTLGRLQLPGSPLRFERFRRWVHKAPPTLGEHTDATRRWLDTTADQPWVHEATAP